MYIMLAVRHISFINAILNALCDKYCILESDMLQETLELGHQQDQFIFR